VYHPATYTGGIVPNLKLKLETVIKIGVVLVAVTAAVVMVKADANATNARIDQHDLDIASMKADDKELSGSVVDLRIAFERLTAVVETATASMVKGNRIRDIPAIPAPTTFMVASSDAYPLTLSDVSAQVGRTPDTVVRWLNERKVDVLKHKTRSGEYRFSHADLAKLLAYATQVHVTEEP
jgi:anti-sigma28 factor (negative regulator of flagellin synthesis)